MKLRIVILSTGTDIGGAEQQLLYLSRALLGKGHQVRIISMIPLGSLGVEAQNLGLNIYSLNMRRGIPNYYALVQMFRWLNDWEPQILISFMFHANILGRLAGLWTKVPVIISSIRNENIGGTQREWLMRITNWMDDMCTTNSHLVAKALAQKQIVAPQKLRVISNAISSQQTALPESGENKIKLELGIDDANFVWLAVGRLEEQKDYPNLLQAFTKIASSNTRLLIVGKGSLQQELHNITNALALSEQVSFLGVRHDIPELLAVTDALVLSSAWEGLPNVIMEALAAGKPVVATNVGGVSELVESNRSGFLVPPGDPAALAGAMARLMTLPLAQRRQMGLIGRSYIESHHSLERIARIWELLCIELLDTKGWQLSESHNHLRKS